VLFEFSLRKVDEDIGLQTKEEEKFEEEAEGGDSDRGGGYSDDDDSHLGTNDEGMFFSPVSESDMESDDDDDDDSDEDDEDEESSSSSDDGRGSRDSDFDGRGSRWPVSSGHHHRRDHHSAGMERAWASIADRPLVREVARFNRRRTPSRQGSRPVYDSSQSGSSVSSGEDEDSGEG
jgi:hypothetical protein